jgi:hypothetical protein
LTKWVRFWLLAGRAFWSAEHTETAESVEKGGSLPRSSVRSVIQILARLEFAKILKCTLAGAG